MKQITDEQRTNNECPKGRYEGNFHRWKVWKWAEPLYASLPVPELESGRFLPSAYGSVVFKCAACGVTHWEDIIIRIDYTPTFDFRLEEDARSRRSRRRNPV